MRRGQNHGRGFLQTQYWNRDMTRNPRYGALGLAMLPVKAADTVQPIYGLTALVVLIVLVLRGNAAVLVPVGAIVLAKTGARPARLRQGDSPVPPLDRRSGQHPIRRRAVTRAC